MFNEAGYQDGIHKRIKFLIDHFSYPFFQGKSVLDLGAGHADIGAAFYRLGARVIAVDSRAEHCKMAKKKYPGIGTEQVDLDKEWTFGHFDLILDLDLICHLKNAENHLRNACNSTDVIVVETAVCDSSDANLVFVLSENKDIYHASHNGFSARPTAAFIERIFSECGMAYKRFDQARLNTGLKVYDWRSQNNNACNENQRRFWIANRIKPAALASLPLIGSGSNTKWEPLIPAPPAPPPPPNPGPRYIPLSKEKEPSPPPLPRIIHQEKRPPTPAPAEPKIRLFVNYYDEKNETRKQELDFCLNKNIENNLLNLIILDSKERPTFDFFFRKINQLAGPNDISIIANADIFFDRSITKSFSIREKQVFTLNRWDWNNGSAVLDKSKENQDVWIVRGKVSNVSGDFPIGFPGSANRIAEEFHKAGYTVIDPAYSIKAYHAHASGIRNYSEMDRIPGKTFNVEITELS